MRTVWAQATRPRLSCAPAPRSSLKSIAARRSAAASAARSQIAACDVFALFLGPVLALAAFADVSWKDKKRKEWEQRFAEINHQLELLRAREVEVWTRIQYRSVRHGIIQQKRMYSSAATAVAQVQPGFSEDVEADQVEKPLFPNASGFTATEETTVTPLGLSALTYRLAAGTSSAPAPHSELDKAADASLIHYEKLLALRLALRMILHNHTGSDDMHAAALYDNTAPDVNAEDVGKVVFRLRAVTDELEAIDKRRQFARSNVDFRRSSHDDDGTRFLRREEIVQLGQLFRNKQIDLAGLVDRISQWLLQTDSKPPGPALYAELVMLFSLNNLPDLARYAVSALQNTSYALSEYEICLMLDHSSVMKNMRAYDWVIHNLTAKDGLLAIEAWEWKRSSGILLPLPVDRNPYLMRALIRTALNFKLPRRAEAYAKLESTFYSRSMMAYVIKAFLQYYTLAQDWTNTYRWLQKAQTWLGTHRTPTHDAMGALMVRVLDGLVAFDKTAQYEMLLEALVAAGIEPPGLDKRERAGSDGLRRIVGHWQSLMNNMNPKPPNSETWSDFKRCMRVVVAELQPATLLPEKNLEHQPAPMMTSPSVEQTMSTEFSSAPSGSLEDTVLRSEQALSRLDEHLVESRQLNARLEKQSTESRITGQQPTVTQSDISMLKELIARERENFDRIRLEQAAAFKEQEATVAALRRELIERERENSERIRVEQEKAMNEQQATIEALREELQKSIEIQSNQHKRIQASKDETGADPPVPIRRTDAETLGLLLEDVFRGPSRMGTSQVLAWASEAESLPTKLPRYWPRLGDDTPTKAHRAAKRFVVNGMKKSKLTYERLQVEAEAAWARVQARKKTAGLTQEQGQITAAEAAAAETYASAHAVDHVIDGVEPGNDSGYDSDSPSSSATAASFSSWSSSLPSNAASIPPPSPEPFRKVGSSPAAQNSIVRRITVEQPLQAPWRKVEPKLATDEAPRRSLDNTVDVLQSGQDDVRPEPIRGVGTTGPSSLFEMPMDLRGGTQIDRS